MIEDRGDEVKIRQAQDSFCVKAVSAARKRSVCNTDLSVVIQLPWCTAYMYYTEHISGARKQFHNTAEPGFIAEM